MSYPVRPLDAGTSDAFAELVERNNGIYGGCWCIGYHPEAGQKGISYRAVRQDRVRTGRAHAALVLDEDGAAQGWCQYGSTEELPGISTSARIGRAASRGTGVWTAQVGRTGLTAERVPEVTRLVVKRRA